MQAYAGSDNQDLAACYVRQCWAITCMCVLMQDLCKCLSWQPKLWSARLLSTTCAKQVPVLPGRLLQLAEFTSDFAPADIARLVIGLSSLKAEISTSGSSPLMKAVYTKVQDQDRHPLVIKCNKNMQDLCCTHPARHTPLMIPDSGWPAAPLLQAGAKHDQLPDWHTLCLLQVITSHSS